MIHAEVAEVYNANFYDVSDAYVDSDSDLDVGDVDYVVDAVIYDVGDAVLIDVGDAFLDGVSDSVLYDV